MGKLTSQEEEAMRAIWKLNGGIISDFLRIMDDPKPAYTTLASTIKNLEKKQFLSVSKFGGINVYHPIIKSDDYQKSILKDIISHYFKGSYKELVSFFVSENAIDTTELKAIIKLIEDNNAN